MRRAERAVLLGFAVALVLTFLWFSRRVVLLAFSGMLVALIFTSIINQIRRFAPIKQGIGVGLVLLLILGIASAIGFLLAPGLISEFSQLADRLPKTIHALLEKAQQSAIFQRLNGVLPDLREMVPSSSKAFSGMRTFFASTFDTIAGFFLLLFIAIFLASNPSAYKNFLLGLIPPGRREDGRLILGRVIGTLKFWLLGQFISMCIIGLLVGVSFAICGLPLSASLGVLAGIGEFVPFVGPFVAVVPAMLLALSQSGQLFLIVLLVYLAIQFIEGHFVMPLVQRQTVDLPPVLTLLAVFFLGNAFGLLGMFVAAPLTAVALVLIEEIYIHRYLGEKRSLLNPE